MPVLGGTWLPNMACLFSTVRGFLIWHACSRRYVVHTESACRGGATLPPNTPPDLSLDLVSTCYVHVDGRLGGDDRFYL